MTADFWQFGSFTRLLLCFSTQPVNRVDSVSGKMSMSIGGWLQGKGSQSQAGPAAPVATGTSTCIPVDRLVDTLPPHLLRSLECPVCFEIVGCVRVSTLPPPETLPGVPHSRKAWQGHRAGRTVESTVRRTCSLLSPRTARSICQTRARVVLFLPCAVPRALRPSCRLSF